MRRRFPREVLLAVLVFAIYWLALCGLSFVMGCGDDHTLPPTAPPDCECLQIPRREAANLRASFPDTAARWLQECDGSTGYLLLAPGVEDRLHGRRWDLRYVERWA